MCFVIGIMEHTRIFLMDCDFSILFNYDYITIYCVNDYMLTILIIPNVFIICHVYYIQISYISNINNAVAQKTYITLRNSYVQVLSHYSYHIPPILILCCTPRLLMTLCTCILQLSIASAILFRYTHLPSKVCCLSKTYFILKHSHVLYNNGRFSFFYLYNFILFVIIIYPFPMAWVCINEVPVMCFHECYKLDLEVTITLCDFIPMFHLKKNIQFITYCIQYYNNDCIMHIDMYMYPYRANKILNNLNATLSVVKHEKAMYVTITFVCFRRATTVDTVVPLPIRFIINTIGRYIFVCFISYLYIGMFHGECCITKGDLIRKTFIHVFANESDRVVTRATICMIVSIIFYIIFVNLHYLTYYDDYYVLLCQCILCNSKEPSFYLSLSCSPGYSNTGRFSSILKILSSLTLTCKAYARGVYRGGYQFNKHYNWFNDHTHYVGLNLLLCYLDNCMSLYCNIVCVWSLDILIMMSRLASILSFICCIVL